MDTYEDIKKSKYRIKLLKLNLSVCHIQDDDKHETMDEVDTDKQV